MKLIYLLVILLIIQNSFGYPEKKLGADFGLDSKILYSTGQVLVINSAPEINLIYINMDAINLTITDRPLPYPNPATNLDIVLAYTLSKSSNIKISIYNPFGRCMKTVNVMKYDLGARVFYNKLPIHLTDDFGDAFGNGIYLVFILDSDTNKVLGKAKIAVSR